MKIYVASSWRNLVQPAIVGALRKLGAEVYDFRNPGTGKSGFRWTAIDPEWEKWTPSQWRAALETHIAREGYENDRSGMDWADTCVLVLPAGRSAHLEAGFMAGQGKPVITVALTPVEPDLMNLLLGPPSTICTRWTNCSTPSTCEGTMNATQPRTRPLIDVFELPDRLLKVLNERGFHTLEQCQARIDKLRPAEWLWRTAFLSLTWEECEEFNRIYCDEMGIRDDPPESERLDRNHSPEPVPPETVMPPDQPESPGLRAEDCGGRPLGGFLLPAEGWGRRIIRQQHHYFKRTGQAACGRWSATGTEEEMMPTAPRNGTCPACAAYVKAHKPNATHPTQTPKKGA